MKDIKELLNILGFTKLFSGHYTKEEKKTYLYIALLILGILFGGYVDSL